MSASSLASYGAQQSIASQPGAWRNPRVLGSGKMAAYDWYIPARAKTGPLFVGSLVMKSPHICTNKTTVVFSDLLRPVRTSWRILHHNLAHPWPRQHTKRHLESLGFLSKEPAFREAPNIFRGDGGHGPHKHGPSICQRKLGPMCPKNLHLHTHAPEAQKEYRGQMRGNRSFKALCRRCQDHEKHSKLPEQKPSSVKQTMHV